MLNDYERPKQKRECFNGLSKQHFGQQKRQGSDMKSNLISMRDNVRPPEKIFKLANSAPRFMASSRKDEVHEKLPHSILKSSKGEQKIKKKRLRVSISENVDYISKSDSEDSETFRYVNVINVLLFIFFIMLIEIIFIIMLFLSHFQY